MENLGGQTKLIQAKTDLGQVKIEQKDEVKPTKAWQMPLQSNGDSMRSFQDMTTTERVFRVVLAYIVLL